MLTSWDRFNAYQSMRTDLWGIREGFLLVCCLLFKSEHRSLHEQCLRVDGNITENAPRVDADVFYIFLYGYKRCVSYKVRPLT